MWILPSCLENTLQVAHATANPNVFSHLLEFTSPHQLPISGNLLAMKVTISMSTQLVVDLLPPASAFMALTLLQFIISANLESSSAHL